MKTIYKFKDSHNISFEVQYNEVLETINILVDDENVNFNVGNNDIITIINEFDEVKEIEICQPFYDYGVDIEVIERHNNDDLYGNEIMLYEALGGQK